MIHVITRDNYAANAQYLAGFAALRHKVFIERLAWTIPNNEAAGCYEYDAFDTSDAVYIVVSNGAGDVLAGLRLLPTDRPCLLDQLFPELSHVLRMSGTPAWEVTRFVTDPTERPQPGAAALVPTLVWALQSWGLANGLGCFVSASFVGMERLLRTTGCLFRRLQTPRSFDGRAVVPLQFEVSDDILSRVESRMSGSGAAPHMPARPVVATGAIRPRPPVVAVGGEAAIAG